MKYRPRSEQVAGGAKLAPPVSFRFGFAYLEDLTFRCFYVIIRLRVRARYVRARVGVITLFRSFP